VIAMAVFNMLAEDGRGGGPAAAVVASLFFLVPTILLYRAKSLFQDKPDG
jgi:hypothetical protein